MTIRKQKHVHQYYKTYPWGKSYGPRGRIRAQWDCALPDCNHFLPGNMAAPVGKFSLCNRCMGLFQLTEDNMELDKPICEICANPDKIVVPDDFDFERMEAKSFIHTKTGKPFEEITEEEIDKIVQFRRLKMSDI
jgi:hypothetical protein